MDFITFTLWMGQHFGLIVEQELTVDMDLPFLNTNYHQGLTGGFILSSVILLLIKNSVHRNTALQWAYASKIPCSSPVPTSPAEPDP